MQHRYTLQPYRGRNTRFYCPQCKAKDKTFVRYIDIQTGQHLAPHVGRCGREINCGYHYKPKEFFADSGQQTLDNRRQTADNGPHVTVTPISFIAENVFKASLAYGDGNNFIKYLTQLFGQQIAGQLVKRYFIGSSKHWPGATVFWQIDMQGKIRTGKIMLYNPNTGHRVKVPFNHIT